MSAIGAKRFKKIYIEITNGCNLRCSFCASDSRPTLSMSVEAFESILQRIGPYTNHIYLHVLGEPLLHPEILSMLSVADSYSIMVNLTSNGMLLDRLTTAPEIYRPIRQINLSLHSMGGTAEPNLQKSYLISVLNRVRWIRDHTHTIISLRLWNISATDKEVSSYNTMACSLIRETFLIPESISLMADQKAGIKLADRIYLNWDHRFAWPGEGNDTTTVKRAFCHGLRDQLAILVDGTVVPCCLDSGGTMALGNINDETLESILGKERTQKILRGFSEGKAVELLCRRCTYRERF
jgi:radical SAM protein with 4Fe4S-binding SPASM domain